MASNRDNGEALLQVAFINWMRSALPDVMVWHVYNENSSNAIQGKIKKDRGVLAGVHDNHLVWAGRNFATIELKSPNKRPSEAKYSDKQQAFAERLDKAGFPHFCCQTGEQCEAAIRSLGLVPLFKFPISLASTGRQMLQQMVADAMYKRD
jgi:hypothetical protein